MSNDTVFRIVLAALATFLYVNHHVIHRRPTVKKTNRVRGLEALLALTASAWTLALALYAAGFAWFDATLPIPNGVRWAGVVAMAACAPLSQWTYQALGAHFSKKLELNSDHRLIRSGPYRFVRHPMYATLFLCAIATCLISANYFVVVSVVAVALVFLLRIRREEAMLVERFGDEYRNYQKQTWALVPKFATIF